jgi:hypothetical protein
VVPHRGGKPRACAEEVEELGECRQQLLVTAHCFLEEVGGEAREAGAGAWPELEEGGPDLFWSPVLCLFLGGLAENGRPRVRIGENGEVRGGPRVGVEELAKLLDGVGWGRGSFEGFDGDTEEAEFGEDDEAFDGLRVV